MEQTRKRNVVVIGLGNVLLSDEGIGVHIIGRLLSQQKKHPLVDFLDAGTAGFSLLHLIANRKKAIIIDCAKMGVRPGTIRRFTADDVQSVKRLSHYSMHEADVLRVISVSRQLGECPDEVVFFGVEPESLEAGQNLTKTLSDKIDSYIADICKELG